MTIPKKLEEKRDELAREFNSKEYGSKIDFKKGFNSACNLLLPEIEKIINRNSICPSDLKSWYEFLEGGE